MIHSFTHHIYIYIYIFYCSPKSVLIIFFTVFSSLMFCSCQFYNDYAKLNRSVRHLPSAVSYIYINFPFRSTLKISSAEHILCVVSERTKRRKKEKQIEREIQKMNSSQNCWNFSYVLFLYYFLFF